MMSVERDDDRTALAIVNLSSRNWRILRAVSDIQTQPSVKHAGIEIYLKLCDCWDLVTLMLN